jgi:hypothetical protein
MSEELIPRPKGEVEKVEITREQALAVYNAGEDMMKDIQLAMALLKRYQRNLSMLGAPDPDIVEARNLMRKHGEAYQGRADTFRIFAGGVDITEHPDSIPGNAEEIVEEVDVVIEDAEVLELEPGD